jgi:hypothetical protein
MVTFLVVNIITTLQEDWTPVTIQDLGKSKANGFVMVLWKRLEKELNFT